jgi:tetratricopeptide (TPR) repeat protein
MPPVEVTAPPSAVHGDLTAPPPTIARSVAPAGTGVFSPGTAFGGRYHVIRLLGAGGMGAVYQAWDNELAVAVALKVIRPEVMVDPDGARDLERRFKRELLLARQVTHKNVVRIHDLGEIDGIKYITMPYIQGTDLATRLHREGRLPVSRALAIGRQVAQGLAAAHEAGVVHRDLKPANIMIDEEDRAIIMDFGIARSTSAGATMIGTVVGTLEYMAPEQAMGQPVDHRADIYAFGLILHDLLLGRRPAARAESAVAELMTRMQRSLPQVRTVDPTIPEPVEEIISTCIQPDPAVRYQTTPELVAALECLDQTGRFADPTRPTTTRRGTRPLIQLPDQPAATIAAPAPARAGFVTRGRLAAAAVALAAVLSAGYVLMGRPGSAPSAEQAAASRNQLSLAVVPFRNQTGDPSLDWIGRAVAEMLHGALPQNRIRTVSSQRVFEVLRDLRVPSDADIDSGTVKRLADFSGAGTIVAGRYVKAGNELRFEATVSNLVRGVSDVVPATAANDRELMNAVAALSRGIEAKLLSETPRAAAATVARPSTQSVDALRAYTEGVELGRSGNHLEALKKFEAAVQADAAFALAYAKLAQTYSNLGHDAQAENASRLAVEHAVNLTERERFLVDATRAQVLNDHKRAIDAYEKLLRLSPDDPEVLFNLARRYEATGAFEQARTHYARVIESDPKYFEGLFAIGRLEVQLKNPHGALDYLNRALTVSVQLDNDEARGSALNALGVAFKRLGRPGDAQRQYAEALEIRKRIGDKRGMASTLSELAQVQVALGKPAEALESYQRSLQLRREIGDKRGLANALNNLGVLYQALGRLDDALTYYKESLQLQTELGNADYQGLALHNIGITLTSQGRYDDAASYLSRALQTREQVNVAAAISETLVSLGELNVRLARYDDALAHFVKALQLSRGADDRRGAARALLGTGAVFEQQGRYRAALEAKKEAVDALRAIKESGPAWVEALASYAHAWSLVAGHDQARPLLEESVAAAQTLTDAAVVALVLNARGEDALLAGKASEASALLADAAQKAEASNDRYLVLLTKLNLAKAQIALGRPQPASASAAAVAKEAGRLGLRHLGADASLASGQALIAQKGFAAARSTVEAALRAAERIGARPLVTRAHYALATSLQLAGQAAAADPHYREATRLLSELETESGSSLVKRADFSDIAARARKSPASD